MKLWAVEFGTFWLSDAAYSLPQASLSKANTTFGEVSLSDLESTVTELRFTDQTLFQR